MMTTSPLKPCMQGALCVGRVPSDRMPRAQIIRTANAIVNKSTASSTYPSNPEDKQRLQKLTQLSR